MQCSDLSWHIEVVFIVLIPLKMTQFKTLFHIKSNLLCLVYRCVVSFLFALQCIFHCVRTWNAVWERHCMTGIATVTKSGRAILNLRAPSTIRPDAFVVAVSIVMQNMHPVHWPNGSVLTFVQEYSTSFPFYVWDEKAEWELLVPILENWGIFLSCPKE